MLRRYMAFMVLALLTLGASAMSYDTSGIQSVHPIINWQGTHFPALNEANVQLQCMNTVAQRALSPRNTADRNTVRHVFGDNPNYPMIAVMTHMLLTARLKILADNADLGPGHERTYGISDEGMIVLTPLFHAASTGVRQRARTLIHEESHCLSETFTTVDYWGIDAAGDLQPTDRHSIATFPDWIYGFWNAQPHYIELKSMFSDFMHLNADTWAVFGYYCRYRRDPPIDTNGARNWQP